MFWTILFAQNFWVEILGAQKTLILESQIGVWLGLRSKLFQNLGQIDKQTDGLMILRLLYVRYDTW